jgi:hypothetical protein
MVKLMHDFMFAVAPYVVPLGVILFLVGWFWGFIKWDLKPAIVGMLLTILLIVIVAVYAGIYIAIGGPQVYPNG